MLGMEEDWLEDIRYLFEGPGTYVSRAHLTKNVPSSQPVSFGSIIDVRDVVRVRPG